MFKLHMGLVREVGGGAFLLVLPIKSLTNFFLPISYFGTRGA